MILVLGYYGFGNLGDETILAVLCEELEQLGFKRTDILVLSGNPGETQIEHGTQAIGRFDLPSLWSILAQSKCLIAGGGSLLQDVTSYRSIPYYLAIIELALLRNVPVIMYGQGIGPIQNPLYRRWVGRAYNKSAASSVRDVESANLLKELGVAGAKVKVTADPVFSLPNQVQEPRGERPRLLLNLRPYQLWEAQQSYWLALIREWQKSASLEFLPLGPGDEELGLKLQAKLPQLKVLPTLNRENLAETFAGASLCVSMRLHGIILSALQGVLPIGLNYDPKVMAICQQLQVKWWELEDLATLSQGIEEVLNMLAEHKLQCGVALERLRVKAAGNKAMLATVLK